MHGLDSAWEILLPMWVSVTVFLSCLCYLPYLYLTSSLAVGRLRRRPMNLFVATLVGVVAWWCCTSFLSNICVFPLLSGFVLLHEMLYYICIVSGVIGLLGWSVLLTGWVVGWRRSRTTSRPSRPPRFQVWLQDAVVATVCYGAGVAIIFRAHLAGLTNREWMMENGESQHLLLMAFLYWPVKSLIAFIVALDVARRMRSGRRVARRLALLLGVFVVSWFGPHLPVLAWCRWRRALVSASQAPERATQQVASTPCPNLEPEEEAMPLAPKPRPEDE